MDSLLNYGSGSESSSASESDNEDKTAHLKPIDPTMSVAKSLAVVAAPDVVPLVSVCNEDSLYSNCNEYCLVQHWFNITKT